MARTNQPKPTQRTHEGAPAYRLNPELQLRRTVMACLLWERSFYEDGVDVADRVAALVPHVAPEKVAGMAIEAREKMKLRHAPLLLVVEMARHPRHRAHVRPTAARVIQRADELAEVLALYSRGREGRKKLSKLSKPLQKGIADAFRKFDGYQLAKYDRKGEVRLRDALFLSHAKPKDAEQAATWRKLIDGTLEAPDTWEVALAQAGSDPEAKRAAWTRLLGEGRLGAMALLRNLRNLRQAGVELGLIREALRTCKPGRVLPFRFVAAARHAPDLEPELEALMLAGLAERERLPGRTALVVDHSASMQGPLSAKSDMTRFDAAAALGVLVREVCEDCVVVVFSASRGSLPPWIARAHPEIGNEDAALVPPRRGFALRDAMETAIHWGGTNTQSGIQLAADQGYDRILVLTDEQSHQAVHNPLVGTRGYFVNVASYRNGIGYGDWLHIDGWSEAVLDYIQALEADARAQEGA